MTDWLSANAALYNSIAQYARLALTGMLLFVIAYQLWVVRARPSEPLLSLNAAWSSAALLMAIGRLVQHATAEPDVVLLGARIFHTGVLLLVPFGLAMAHEIRGVPRGRLFWLLAIGGAVPVPLVWFSTLVISDQVQVFQTLAGPVLGPVPTRIAPLAIPYLIEIAVYLIYVARRGTRVIPWSQRLPLTASAFLLLPALLNDVLLYSDAIRTVEMVNLALFLNILTINAAIFSRAGELFADMEHAVEERTRELLAREATLSRMLAERRRLLDAIPDVICVLGDDRFEYANDAAERFFARTRTELTGMRFTDFVVPGQRADAARCLAAIRTSSTPAPAVDLRFAMPGSAERSAEVTGLLIELGNGPRLLVSARDVTERKLLMAQLQTADRLASVGTLAAGIAHEINNPLTFLSGNLALIQASLAREPLSTSEALEVESLMPLLDDCATGTQRIAQIVRDLNVYTRADERPSAVDCRTVLDFALKIAVATIRHRATVTQEHATTPLVVADSGRLSQVFLNLLLNAAQAIPADGDGHVIHLRTYTRQDGWAVVEIIDSGTGIDPAVRETVFEPFVTTKQPGHGTGLGLFICHRIITDLGGTIRLRPAPTKGTVAEIALPPAPVAAVAATETRAERAFVVGQPAIRVLIADDEEAVLRVLSRVLSHFAVTTVPGGAQAIRAIEADHFDVVLCDLMMPGCSGAEVWRHAQRLGMSGRVVIMTGGATTDALREFIETTNVSCVEKPFSLPVLQAAIDACLASAEASSVS